MSDPTRTRHDGGLSNLLAYQLNALAEEWAPDDRHDVRFSNTEDRPAADDRNLDLVETDLSADEIREDEVRVDDVPALIARSFDYEAALWLWQCASAPGGSTSH